CEGLLANHRGVVVSPTTYHPVKSVNQMLLPRCLVVLDDPAQFLDMPSYCFWAWLDECLETKEIKTCLPIHILQRMSDAGLAGLQFEPKRSQPFSRCLCAMLDDMQVW